MVLKGIALAPAASAPPAAKRASSSRCILQGVKLLQVDAMPTCGFSKSPSTKPTARNIARLGACFTPSTTMREKWRVSTELDFFAMALRLKKTGLQHKHRRCPGATTIARQAPAPAAV